MIATSFSLEQIQEAARWFLSQIGSNRILAFYGDLGAGKTTFIKAVCQELGVQSLVNSPTFAIINEYATETEPVYHFDFYRIKRKEEAFDIGSDEYFDSGCYCFIEWPDKLEDLLPEEALNVSIRVEANGNRRIEIDGL